MSERSERDVTVRRPAPSGAPATIATAYSATGGAWAGGPERVYARLATLLVGACPGGVAGRRVLDLGAGTGVASTAARAAGAAGVVAADVAFGVLAHDAERRPPAVVADARGLPFAPASFGAVVAAFSLNHLTDPGAGLAEAARVLMPGGGLAVSAVARGDDHPVKQAVDEACEAIGWRAGAWYDEVRRDAAPRLGSVGAAIGVAAAAGLAGAEADLVDVPYPDLGPPDLVAWRLGMAQVAPFVAELDAAGRAALAADALARLGPAPPVLVRSCVVLTWRRPT